MDNISINSVRNKIFDGMISEIKIDGRFLELQSIIEEFSKTCRPDKLIKFN